MARMIDADRLLRELTALSHGQVWPGWTYDGIRLLIERQPTLTPPNEPLTLEQLREMDGEPVYDYLGQEWYVIQEYYDHELTMTDGTRFFDDDEIDGVDKRFYRRPPEGESNA